MGSKTFLLGAKTQLGDKIINGEDINISNGNLKDKMGINTVREFTDTDQYNSIIICIDSLLQELGLEYKNIDGIFCSSTGTYDILPGLANVIASRMGLSSEKPRVNVGSACSGAIQALYYANDEMKKKKELTGKDQNFLVIASDIRSKTKDATTMPMMSDASGVMLISTKQLGSSYEIGDISINSMEVDENSLRSIEQKHHEQLTMPNGKAVYKFAVQVGKEVFDTLVKGSGGVIFYIPHNANAKIIESIEKSLGDNATVWKESIKEGNLGGASIIHGLESVMRNTDNKPDQIVLGAFGANLEYGGANLIKVSKEVIEDQDYIVPNLTFEALSKGKVWEFKEIINTKTVSLEEVNESLEGYEYLSPKMCITQDLVDFFINIIGDSNPHYDEEISKDTKLGKPPVPGSLQQSMITNEAVIHNAIKVTGSNHLVIENNFNFRKPILVGDKIHYKLKIISAKRGFVERDVRILVGEQEKGRGMFKSLFQKK